MSYNFNSFVNNREADALKEMIFKRAQERSKAYTEDVQADVMDLARESFVSSGNPFSKIIEKQENEITTNTTEKITKESKTEEAIGFPQRKLNSNIVNQNNITQENFARAAIQTTMVEARSSLSGNKSFMGALNFLNTQAAVSLMRTRADKFEVVG